VILEDTGWDQKQGEWERHSRDCAGGWFQVKGLIQSESPETKSSGDVRRVQSTDLYDGSVTGVQAVQTEL
jgi:hypothetical protein